MSTKKTIFFTEDNEHCYTDITDDSVLIEINRENVSETFFSDGKDGFLSLRFKADSHISKILKSISDNTLLEKEYIIPENCEAKIEGNKITITNIDNDIKWCDNEPWLEKAIDEIDKVKDLKYTFYNSYIIEIGDFKKLLPKNKLEPLEFLKYLLNK